MTAWRTVIEPFARPVFFAYARATRGATLGVRGMAIHEDGRVLLVKHTYLHGWWLPGGGVERGETCEQAILREMREEGGVIIEERPRLISIHANERFFRGDHVLLYRIDRFSTAERTHRNEIADIGWFHPEALPADTDPGTRARISEVFAGAASATSW